MERVLSLRVSRSLAWEAACLEGCWRAPVPWVAADPTDSLLLPELASNICPELQVAAEEAGSKLVKIHSKKDYDSLINSGQCPCHVPSATAKMAA